MKFHASNPVEPMVLLQGFGVNGDYYRSHGINIKGHNGWDLKASHGQPVYASHDGIALYQIDENQGHGVVVITNEQYDYLDGQAYFKTVYWHLCNPLKEPKFKSPIADKGAWPVKKGDLIGYADSTGFSTGDHLHFAIKPVAKSGESIYTWGNIEYGNGYMGCVDPTFYMDPIEDLKLKAKLEVEVSILQKLISLWKQLLAKR